MVSSTVPPHEKTENSSIWIHSGKIKNNTIFTSHLERMSNYVPLPNNAGLVRRSRLCSSWAVNLGYWRKWHQLGKSCLAKNKYIISSKISVKTIFNPQWRKTNKWKNTCTQINYPLGQSIFIKIYRIFTHTKHFSSVVLFPTVVFT